MSYTYNDTVTLKTEICYSCGIVFAVPADWQQNRRNDHKGFWCPNGHQQSYQEASEAEVLKRQLEKEQRAQAPLRENLVAAQRAQERAEKALARHKKRSAAGVCPCCNRTVKQLAEHMQSKHADFMQLQGLTPPKQLPEKVH